MTYSTTNPNQTGNASSSLDILLQAIEIDNSQNTSASSAQANITSPPAAAQRIAHEFTQTQPSSKRLASELSTQPSTVANKRAKTTGLPAENLFKQPSKEGDLKRLVFETISKHQGTCQLTLDVFKALSSEPTLKKLHPLSEMMGAKTLKELPDLEKVKNVTLLTSYNSKDAENHALLLQSILKIPAVRAVARKLYLETILTVSETAHLQKLTNYTAKLISLINASEPYFGLDHLAMNELVYCDKILSRILLPENAPAEMIKRFNTNRQFIALALVRKSPNHVNQIANCFKFADPEVITESLVRSHNGITFNRRINNNHSPQIRNFINQLNLYLTGRINLQNRPQDRNHFCLVMAACKKNPQQFVLASDRIKNSESAVRRIIKVAPTVFVHMTNDLTNKFSVVFEAVTNDPHNLAFVPFTYKKNKDIVKQAVLKDDSAPLAGFTFLHAAPELKDDKEFVMQLLEEKPAVFLHISERLSNDAEVVMYALTKHPALYSEIEGKFKNNTDFMQQAINTTPAILNRMQMRKIVRFIKNNPDHYASLNDINKRKTAIVTAALRVRPELVNLPNIFPDVATRTFAMNFVNNMA